tara:strand:- start:468 stop:1679 length:1212 start_codon:yes stop_codon:yes gene_type:complete
MNNEKIAEQFIKNAVNKIILTELSWGTDDSNYGGGPTLDIFKTLIEPFTDVFKVAFIAAKDITSTTFDVTNYILTFDPEKRADIKERYRQRRLKYADQMSKAMESTEAIFNSPDAKALAFFAAPGYFMTKSAAKLAWSAAEPARDQVEDFFGGTLGIGDQNIAASTAKDKSPGLMADLKRAFFGEGLDEIDEIEMILIEQEELEAAGAPTAAEIEDMANDYLESSGTKKDIDKAWEELMDDKQSEIDEILKQQKTKMQLLGTLSVATTMEEAQSAITALKAIDVDLSKQFADASSEMKEQIQKIQNDDSASEEIIEQLRNHPDAKGFAKDEPKESFFPIIEKGLLATIFGSAVDDARKASAGDLLGFVAEMSKDELSKLSSLSSRGKQYADLIFKFRDDLLAL